MTDASRFAFRLSITVMAFIAPNLAQVAVEMLAGLAPFSHPQVGAAVGGFAGVLAFTVWNISDSWIPRKGGRP